MPIQPSQLTDLDPDPLGAPPPLPAAAALYLDFDGTLVELAVRPDAVVVRTELPSLLEAVAGRLGGALAVITGRLLADVDALLAPARLRGAGLHGAELRGPRVRPAVRVLPGIAGLLPELREWFAGDPRILVEDKAAVVSLHFRKAPERGGECEAALRHLAARRPGLEVIAGNHVVEARARGANKGRALRRLSREPPFAGRLPVFVGDDRTDEDAFVVAAGLGGYGIKVGEGETQARYRCADVAAVHTWLRSSLTDRP